MSRKPSTTQLSVQKLAEMGYKPFVVEFFAYGKKHDLFGFGDIVGLGHREMLIVQCTTASHVSDRVKKITEHENVGLVREAGIRIVVWGWREKDGEWICREVDLS